MAFNPWKFRYNPPPTVPAAAAAGGVAPTAAAVSGTDSQAARLMVKLDEMIAASTYLQQVMLARSKGLGIAVDPRVDSEVARALEVAYSVAEAPKVITVEMYSRLLDAEMTALQIEMALPLDSPYEVNAFQTAAAAQVTSFVEDKLVETGEFRHQIPLLLRNLKGDSVIFAATKGELAKYPAAVPREDVAVPRLDGPQPVIKAKTLDISRPLASYLDGYVDEFAGVYASMYTLAAGVGHIENDVEQVVNTYLMQPMEDIIRIVSLFQTMKGLVHVPRMKTILKGLTGLVFVRLQAEAAAMRCFYDRFASLAVAPIKSMAGSLGRMLGEAQAAVAQADRLNHTLAASGDNFTHAEGGLKGMSFEYDCGLPHNANNKKPAKAPKPPSKVQKAGQQVAQARAQTEAAVDGALQKTSQALTSMATHLKWGLDAVDAKTGLVDEAFSKIANRRLLTHSEQLDLMCSTQALDSMMALAKTVISAQQKYTGTATATPPKLLEMVGRILTSVDNSTDRLFAMQDGQIQATPPNVPPIPATVAPVLQRGGLDPKKVLA